MVVGRLLSGNFSGGDVKLQGVSGFERPQFAGEMNTFEEWQGPNRSGELRAKEFPADC